MGVVEEHIHAFVVLAGLDMIACFDISCYDSYS